LIPALAAIGILGYGRIGHMDIETMADQNCGNIGLEIAERQDEVGLRGFSRPACSGRTTLHGDVVRSQRLTIPGAF
jgi:hypothetical protein